MTLPVLDRESSEPLAAQIAAHFSAAIDHGHYRPGDRLPTIRSVADRVGVTRATVQNAYHRLGQNGLVAGTVGRGTVSTSLVHRCTTSPLSASSNHVQGRRCRCAKTFSRNRRTITSVATAPHRPCSHSPIPASTVSPSRMAPGIMRCSARYAWPPKRSTVAC